MKITLVPAYNHPQEIGTLFTEYTQLLLAGDPTFQAYLDQQHYDAEVEHLEEKYGLPQGRLYVAYCDDALAGCIGLRRMDAQRCEMKRLYVRPEFRGKQIARRLVTQIIDDAREIGYSSMFLDTLPFLEHAIRLYQHFGFYEIESYNDSPMEKAIYMRLDL